MKRRFIPLLLAAALCLGLLTIGAAAEGPYTADDYDHVYVNGQLYKDFSQDLTVTIGEGTVTLDVDTATLTVENVTLEENIEVLFGDSIYVVSTDKTLTVVLKGSNSITTQYCGIYTDANMVVNADAGASLEVNSTGDGSNYFNGIYCKG